MKILAFDVSKKNTGICFKDDHATEVHNYKFKSLLDYYRMIIEYIDLYKPDMVVYSGTVMMFHTRSVKPMVMLMALVELACEKREVEVIVVGDTAVRKEMIGKNAKKADVLPWVNKLHGLELIDADICDSVIFAEYIYKLYK